MAEGTGKGGNVATVLVSDIEGNRREMGNGEWENEWRRSVL